MVALAAHGLAGAQLNEEVVVYSSILLVNWKNILPWLEVSWQEPRFVGGQSVQNFRKAAI